MSNLQFGPQPDLCFVDKRRASGQTNTNPLGTPANYKDVSSIDTRLAAVDANAYSAANLRTMNLNDKIYALRLADDSAGV